MIPGLNPAKMGAMMKQMGIKQEEINASRVIIEKEGENIIIENPQILKINMQGNESFQITGDIKEEGVSQDENDKDKDEGFSKEDIEMIVEKTGKNEEEVMDSLQKTNDIAETIMELS